MSAMWYPHHFFSPVFSCHCSLSSSSLPLHFSPGFWPVGWKEVLCAVAGLHMCRLDWTGWSMAALWPGPCPSWFVWTSSSPCFSHTAGRHSDIFSFFFFYLVELFMSGMKLSAVTFVLYYGFLPHQICLKIAKGLENQKAYRNSSKRQSLTKSTTEANAQFLNSVTMVLTWCCSALKMVISDSFFH